MITLLCLVVALALYVMLAIVMLETQWADWAFTYSRTLDPVPLWMRAFVFILTPFFWTYILVNGTWPGATKFGTELWCIIVLGRRTRLGDVR